MISKQYYKLLYLIRCYIQPNLVSHQINDGLCFLDLSNPHEKKYFEGKESIDQYIAKFFIRKGDVVIDAGANIGFVAMLYAALGARVYAFEPIPTLYSQLAANAAGREIKPFKLALSNISEKKQIALSSTHSQGHSLNELWPEKFSKVFGGESIDSMEIECTTIDSLNLPSARFMKVDVEGSELNLFKGGQHYLNQNSDRLVIQVELYDFQYEECASYLRIFFSYHYRCVYHKTTKKLKFLDAVNHNIDLDKCYLFNPPTYIFTNYEIKEG